MTEPLLCETHRARGIEVPTDYLVRGPDGSQGICVRCIVTAAPFTLIEPLYTTAEMHPNGPVNFRVSATAIARQTTLSDHEVKFRDASGDYRRAILAELATKVLARHPDASRSPSSVGETITILLVGDGRTLKLLGVYVGSDRALTSDDDTEIAAIVSRIVTVDPAWAYEGTNDFQLVLP